jgi:hypothetical protein
MYIGLYVKYSILLLESSEIQIFLKISNFVKIRPVGAELVHADGRTDTTKLIVAFRNFANAPTTMVKFSYLFTAVIDPSQGITDSNSIKNVSLCLKETKRRVCCRVVTLSAHSLC